LLRLLRGLKQLDDLIARIGSLCRQKTRGKKENSDGYNSIWAE
jgi:hypothetical protein